MIRRPLRQGGELGRELVLGARLLEERVGARAAARGSFTASTARSALRTRSQARSSLAVPSLIFLWTALSRGSQIASALANTEAASSAQSFTRSWCAWAWTSAFLSASAPATTSTHCGVLHRLAVDQCGQSGQRRLP